jgi:hypothetical protein
LSARVLTELEETIGSGSTQDVATELRRLATSILHDPASRRSGRATGELVAGAEALRARMRRMAFEIELDPARFTGAQMTERVRGMLGSYRRSLFGDLRGRFYRLIGGDAAVLRGLSREEFESADRLRRTFRSAGLEVPSNGNAPYWRVNRDALVDYLREHGVITGDVDFSTREWVWLARSDFRIPLSIEHIERLTDHPALGLDPMNFMFTLLRENTVLLERIRSRGR